jgi:hypothetical protein
MHNRNKSRIFYIQVLLLIFVFLAGVFAPTEVFARMERTTGSGMAEGDPGDGDDSIGGGGGGGTIPDGAPSAVIEFRFLPNPCSTDSIPFFSEPSF